MARWEHIEGSSRKFWEIELDGRTFTTRYGRIGATPQSTTKKLASPEAATKAHDALVREKEKKGYRVVGAKGAMRARTAASRARSPKRPTRAPSVSETLEALERFLAAVQTLPELALTLYEKKRVRPIGRAEMARFEKKTGRRIPDDVRDVYARGIATGVIEGPKAEGYGMLDFQPLAAIEKQLRWWRPEDSEWASRDPGWWLRAELEHHGLPLWQEESSIVVDCRTGAVGRVSGEPSPSDWIAPSFSAFFAHYVASGCFHYGAAEKAHFAKYFDVVRDIVPFGIAPADNLWLQHLDRWYRGNITRKKVKIPIERRPRVLLTTVAALGTSIGAPARKKLGKRPIWYACGIDAKRHPFTVFDRIPEPTTPDRDVDEVMERLFAIIGEHGRSIHAVVGDDTRLEAGLHSAATLEEARDAFVSGGYDVIEPSSRLPETVAWPPALGA